MIFRTVKLLLLFTPLALSLLPSAESAETGAEHERILAAFSPYRNGSPQVDGITPGMTLDSANASVAATVLPPEILKYLAAGDFSVTVQTTDMPLRKAYIEATLAHYGKVVVGEEELQNYVAGRPFLCLIPKTPKSLSKRSGICATVTREKPRRSGQETVSSIAMAG